MNVESLAACPFCGGLAKVQKPQTSTFEQYQPSTPAKVECVECGARVQVPANIAGALMSVKGMWNRRTPS